MRWGGGRRGGVDERMRTKLWQGRKGGDDKRWRYEDCELRGQMQWRRWWKERGEDLMAREEKRTPEESRESTETKVWTGREDGGKEDKKRWGNVSEKKRTAGIEETGSGGHEKKRWGGGGRDNWVEGTKEETERREKEQEKSEDKVREIRKWGEWWRLKWKGGWWLVCLRGRRRRGKIKEAGGKTEVRKERTSRKRSSEGDESVGRAVKEKNERERDKVWEGVKKRRGRKWGKGGGGRQESESLSSQKFVALIGGVNPANLTNLAHKPVQKARWLSVCVYTRYTQGDSQPFQQTVFIKLLFGFVSALHDLLLSTSSAARCRDDIYKVTLPELWQLDQCIGSRVVAASCFNEPTSKCLDLQTKHRDHLCILGLCTYDSLRDQTLVEL